MYRRVAVLIDGGFFRKRYREIYKGLPADPKELAKKLYGILWGEIAPFYEIHYLIFV